MAGSRRRPARPDAAGPEARAKATGCRLAVGPDAAAGNRRVGFGAPDIYARIPNSRMGVIFLVRDAFQKALEYRAARERDGELDKPDPGAVDALPPLLNPSPGQLIYRVGIGMGGHVAVVRSAVIAGVCA